MSHLENLLEVDTSTVLETEPWTVGIHPGRWTLTQNGIWTIYRRTDIPRFGWKIHVSSALVDALDILSIVSNIAFQNNCSFKHLKGADSFRTLHFKMPPDYKVESLLPYILKQKN